MKKVFTILHKENDRVTNMKAIEKMFAQLKNGKHILEVSPYNKRSNPQNRYLHGLLIPEFRKALNSVGYDEVKTDRQAKDILKSMFLTAETVSKETGEMIKYVRHTSDLTKEELGILIEEVIKFAAENMSYEIPFPSEQLLISYE